MKRTWMILLAIGCGHKDAWAPAAGTAHAGAGSAQAGSAAPLDCKARAAHLAERMHDVAARSPGYVPFTGDLHSLEVAMSKPIDMRGPVLAVTKDGKGWVESRPLESLEQADEYVDRLDKRTLENFYMAPDSTALPPKPWPFYVWVDRDAPVSAVASYVALIPREHWTARLLVAGPQRPAEDVPAGAKEVASKIPAKEPEATAYLARQLRAAIGACSDLVMSFATSDSQLPAVLAEKVATTIPAGVAACDCRIPDLDVFEWGVVTWLGGYAPSLAWIDMPALARADRRHSARTASRSSACARTDRTSVRPRLTTPMGRCRY